MSKFDEWLHNLVNPNNSGPEKTGPILYHYTDSNGLIGIVSNKTIRLGDIRYMNDPSERTYGVEVARSALEKRVSELPEDLSQMIKNSLHKLETDADLDLVPFAFSLSKYSDNLQQWRSYCKNGLGYCLGFKVQEICQPTSGILGLFRVRYVRSKQEFLFSNLFDVLSEIFLSSERGDVTRKTVMKFCELGISIISSIVKDQAYHVEGEWRLLELVKTKRPQHIEFLAKDQVIRPFLTRKIDDFVRNSDGFATSIIDHVYLGPNLDSSVPAAVAMLFRRYDWKIPELRRSRVPMRII